MGNEPPDPGVLIVNWLSNRAHIVRRLFLISDASVQCFIQNSLLILWGAMTYHTPYGREIQRHGVPFRVTAEDWEISLVCFLPDRDFVCADSSLHCSRLSRRRAR
jgi:hypothetical protein